MTDTIIAHKDTLLQMARASISHGLEHHQPLLVEINDFAAPLREIAATFVTLMLNDNLRGCIGKLEAVQPLIIDVSRNAYAAAFQDPRFLPLSKSELPLVQVEISILSPAERLHIDSERELIKQLRPGVDGLIIEKGQHRGTFLPSVWQQLNQPSEFIRHLKRKAGISEGDASSDIRYFRYTTIKISE